MEGAPFLCLVELIELRDALDRHRFKHYRLYGLILSAGFGRGDLVDHILPLDHFAEDGVLAGEPRSGRDGDKELAAVCSRTTIGHCQLAGFVETVRRALGLILEAIAGS